MCVGGRPSAPPPPAPSIPPRSMNMQAAPTPAETTGRSRSTGDAVETSRRGRRILRIPLLKGIGSGVQLPIPR